MKNLYRDLESVLELEYTLPFLIITTYMIFKNIICYILLYFFKNLIFYSNYTKEIFINNR